MEVIQSKNNVSVRLTKERWLHITEEHSELAGYYFEVLETIETPEEIYQGMTGEYIAIKKLKKINTLLLFTKKSIKKMDLLLQPF